MPNLPFRRRHGDPADAPQLDELLDAGRLDANAAPEWQSVSDVLRSAAAAAEPSELAAETAVLAAFRRERVGIRHRRPQPIARCKSMFSTLLTGRIAVGLAAGVVTVTGAATAAYACVLPSPIQSFAHSTIGAPKPTGTSSAYVDPANWKHYPNPSGSWSPSPTVSVTVSTSTSVSPTPTPDPSVTPSPSIDPAVEALIVYRVCQEYTALTKDGKTLDPKALALLTKAAGSASAIAAYCAALPVPPSACLSAPLPTVSASTTPTATATATPDKDFFKGAWWRWCGICPTLKGSPTATPTVTPSVTATATPSSGKPGFKHVPWFW
ncbi:MAG TPA: hypothetical protein VK662_07490, partial [Acidothermaceae bacterium]|nr:hypothetical protein [Acidothermaceae bacterium]